jgi:dTDP-4-dehydrorhamnose 3,5-epimerase
MIIKEASKQIKNLFIFKPEIFRDYRGENVETFNPEFIYKALAQIDEFREDKLTFEVDSFSFSRKNVLRGFHGDTRAWKLIQCVQGSIYFVVIDVRENSPTKGNYQTFILDDKDRYQILVPRGCVNAHLCLSDTCAFLYKLTYGYVNPTEQIAVKWNDSKYNIPWPITNPILSLRDK